jgi:hypothetical protein
MTSFEGLIVAMALLATAEGRFRRLEGVTSHHPAISVAGGDSTGVKAAQGPQVTWKMESRAIRASKRQSEHVNQKALALIL